MRLPKTASGKVCFPGLSPRAYEHPADRAALAAMRAIPGFPTLLKKIIGALGERSLRLIFLSSAARVGPKQFPQLWEDYLEACEILNIKDPPELFVSQTPTVNAMAVGTDRPFIVIHSAMLKLMDREEVQCVLGHELGHCLSGHVLYKTMVHILAQLAVGLLHLPGYGLAVLGIITALLEWDRKSELSADRAGLLVAQDPNVANRVDLKLAGGGDLDQMSLEAFEEQAEEYESGGNALDSFWKLVNLWGRTHPFPVLRLREIRRWVDSGEYNQILKGNYEKTADGGKVDIFGEALATLNAYKKDAQQSKDPLIKVLNKLTIGSASLAKDAVKTVRGFVSKKK